jgi:uroporphyrin-III C-methyltransferase/precorrin-2 dehydrogenase/sirohydrochlorin ferrochelatase
LIDALPLYHSIAGKVVIVLGSGEAGEARRRLVERAGGTVVGELESAAGPGAGLAFVALHDEAEAEAAAQRLRAAGLLVNVADRPELCDFTVPAILERSPVVLAIGSGGSSAALAKALRLRLEALLPASLGRLAEALGGARQRLRQRWSDAGERRRALDAALGEGGALDPLREDSAEGLEAWLSDTPASQGAGLVEIRLASDDPEELTLRQARALGSADLLAHEQGVPAAILDRARADAGRIAIAPGETAPDAAGLVVVLRTPAPAAP